jgi:hypothetical protein
LVVAARTQKFQLYSIATVATYAMCKSFPSGLSRSESYLFIIMSLWIHTRVFQAFFCSRKEANASDSHAMQENMFMNLQNLTQREKI